MGNVAVVGAQWGDEGKGKIVDWLSERADVVVRFQGGHNAGHTLVIGNNTFKLSLLPSGVVRPGKLSIIGNGVVVDPWALLAEIASIAKQGVEVGPDRLRIAENACLILPPTVHSSGRDDSGTSSAQTPWTFRTVSSDRGPFSVSRSERIVRMPSSSFTTIGRALMSLLIARSCFSK